MTFDNHAHSIALELADLAGDIIRQHYKQQQNILKKADNTLVTVADRDAEMAMRKHIMLNFPEHGIIGEEHGVHNPEAEYQWVLDPIDGTHAFIAGYPTFTTLIGLAVRNKPVLGIIDQPVLNQRWSSKQGHYNTSQIKKLRNATLCTTSTYHFNDTEGAAFERLRERSLNTILGGDGFAYAQLAAGRIDVVVDSKLKPYDFCALPSVIKQAGGIMTDWKGNPLTLDSNGQVVATANKELHAEVLDILASTA